MRPLLLASVLLLGACAATTVVERTPEGCRPGELLREGACFDVASGLNGLRWEMRCLPEHGRQCVAERADPARSAALGGEPGVLYEVRLRVRGVVELAPYRGGLGEGHWYDGGDPADGNANLALLTVSEPAQHHFLNAGEAGRQHPIAVDYAHTIRVAGGAEVTLSAHAQDGLLLSNRGVDGRPLVVQGIPPSPRPFDGQFLQVDVVSVARYAEAERR